MTEYGRHDLHGYGLPEKPSDYSLLYLTPAGSFGFAALLGYCFSLFRRKGFGSGLAAF